MYLFVPIYFEDEIFNSLRRTTTDVEIERWMRELGC